VPRGSSGDTDMAVGSPNPVPGRRHRPAAAHAQITRRQRYEALLATPDPASLVWGSCRHPIVSGTGAFAGARGVVAMVDIPTRGGVKTAYIGNVTLRGHGRRHARARASAVAAPGGCG
jgi:hypothetical protein